MQFVSSGKMRVKLVVVAAAFCLAVVGFLGFSAKIEKVAASASGPSASHTNAPGENNCSACHADFAANSGTGGITVAGIPANYLPNQQVSLTVTTSQSDAVLYGFQLTAVDSLGKQVGTFTVPGGTNPQMQLKNGSVGGNPRIYVEHTINGITPTQFGSKSWNFTWQAPAQRVGKISFYAAGNAANSDGGTSGDYIYTTSKAALSGTAISNFDGDTASDIAVYRPSNGTWYSLNSNNNQFNSYAFGTSGDLPAAGDYDGDGKTDYAIFRPSNANWCLQQSTAGFSVIPFGLSSDKPVAGDYDGDGKTDVAVYRPSSGTWYILGSRDGFTAVRWGLSTDKLVPGDYDGDGKTDPAVYRPSDGTWYILGSRIGFTTVRWGNSTDVPVPGDYDGDGKTDPAVYRPSDGSWYRLGSTQGFTTVRWGLSTDKPVPGDYDGDGKTDAAIYRDGVWAVLKSSDSSYFSTTFGNSSDTPVPTNYIPQ